MTCKRVISQERGERCNKPADFEIIALKDGTKILTCYIHFIETCQYMVANGEQLVQKVN